VAPAVPAAPGGAGNPVDAFVSARLAAEGLEAAGEAERSVLLRRVYFDLIGLPPTPEERRAFLADESPGAYEAVVDRLLASPRHGERWARHWMDAAHFAETHGHDQDRIRTNAWPYRDYLVASLNGDKPYGRFVEEQVAGDVLFPGDPQATVALGFIAAGPWDESSLRDIREETLDRQIGRYLDRDDMVGTVMSVVASSTAQCARCHDHKFDPISQRDYYALQAVFAGVERANRAWDADPERHARRQGLLRTRRALARGEGGLLESAETREAVAAWREANGEGRARWSVVEPRTAVSTGGATLTRMEDGSFLASGARPETDVYALTFDAPAEGVTALQLELLPDGSLPKGGPGRQPENGNLHLSEIQLLVFEPGAAAGRVAAIGRATADFSQEGWTVAHAVDGVEKTAWGIHPREGEARRAVFELASPQRGGAGATFAVVLRQSHGGAHTIGRFRLSATAAEGPLRLQPAEIVKLAAAEPGSLTAEEWRTLAGHVLRERVEEGLAALPRPSLVYAAANDFEPDGSLKPSLRPREVSLLRRGEITMPVESAGPGALSCVEGLAGRFEVSESGEEGERRAALARWLTDRGNGLTWRSIVNRVWHHHFGAGIVETPNDFGRMGGAPSHPELLDWLAAWFRDEAGGSLKALHRLLVTSEAYRRGSSPTGRTMERGLAADPGNRLLWRMNRARLDAECARDAILALGGRLDLRMGGPGDMQFDLQPGIHVTPKVDYTKFDVDSAAGSRRSIYRFLFRTLPDPFMEALDCPAGDQLTGARVNSVTVQQALALWNSAFATRQAAHWAARLEGEGGTLEGRVAVAVEEAFGRVAEGEEVAELAAYAKEHGLANTCRLLLNANEFVFIH